MDKLALKEAVLNLLKMEVVKGVGASYFSKKYKLPLREVEDCLNELVSLGVIDKKYQLRCSEDFCSNLLAVSKNKGDFNGNSYECDRCGYEFENGSEGTIKELFTRKE